MNVKSKIADSVSYIISGNGSLTVFVKGESYNIMPDHKNYDTIVKALKSKNFSEIPVLIDLASAIVTFSSGNLSVKNGDIYYKDILVKNALTDRILMCLEKDLPFEPLLAFFENLMLNPSRDAIEELFGFLEKNTLPITQDGCFLAYKRVTKDWKDFHTGSIDNSIGAKPYMDRALVDNNRNSVCSSGLHFCSKEYLSSFNSGAGRVIVVKLNPKDVVSIPIDYNNSKGRCCEYEVICEIESEIDKNCVEHNFGSVICSNEGKPIQSKGMETDDEEDEDEDRDYEVEFEKDIPRNAKGQFTGASFVEQKRDARGRFV